METKIKVLLADNSEHFGKPCADAMRAHDLEVYTVEKDGKQVLEGIAKRHPHVVLMDFFLPRLDAIGAGLMHQIVVLIMVIGAQVII